MPLVRPFKVGFMGCFSLLHRNFEVDSKVSGKMLTLNGVDFITHTAVMSCCLPNTPQ